MDAIAIYLGMARLPGRQHANPLQQGWLKFKSARPTCDMCKFQTASSCGHAMEHRCLWDAAKRHMYTQMQARTIHA
eukprot:1140719-Pelagomonas_calceolata.AAC.2